MERSGILSQKKLGQPYDHQIQFNIYLDNRAVRNNLKRYSEKIKKAMVLRMLAPGGPSSYYLEKEVGIGRGTLKVWLKKYGNLDIESGGTMKNNKLTSKAKFKLVMKYENIKEDTDKGEFLRQNGLHTSDIVEWKMEMLDALDGKKTKDNQKTKGQITRRIKELEREIRRKDKALAETAALIILKKKAQEIWGEIEED